MNGEIMTKDSDKTERFLDDAYDLQSLEDALGFYSEWAEDYDEQMEQRLKYVAPRLMAEHLAAHIPDKNARILDVGCGTGLTSLYMHRLGYSGFDGIDISTEMLAVAKKRGIYSDLIQADITKTILLPDASYDAIISSGTFTLGHVGGEPLPELARLMKPGAMLGCTIHQDIWQPKGFEAAFEKLINDGILTEIQREKGKFFADHPNKALYCIFRRL